MGPGGVERERYHAGRRAAETGGDNLAARPALGVAELSAYLDEVFPQMRDGGMTVEALAPMTARARLSVEGAAGARHLRPGGTVSGPAMAALADCAFYAALLGMVGREPLAVTVTLSLTFLRKPAAADLLCEARILKLGRRLVLGDALLYSEGAAAPVAQASLTYARPSGESANERST